jgi:hypothetical protein
MLKVGVHLLFFISLGRDQSEKMHVDKKLEKFKAENRREGVLLISQTVTGFLNKDDDVRHAA